MERDSEDVVDWVFRNFGENFPKGVLSFRYSGVVYPIHNCNRNRLTYGVNLAVLRRDSRYRFGNLVVKKTLFGPKATFDLTD